MFKSVFRERRRSVAVHNLGIVATLSEPAFDRFVSSAASGFDAPIASLSLIHDQEHWYKAGHGAAITCIPRNHGFCHFALERHDVLEVCDPQADARFAALPSVIGDPFVRYYIGAPLRRLSGIDVGALCVVDTVHRRPASADQKAFLLGLARQASLAMEALLDSRRNAS